MIACVFAKASLKSAFFFSVSANVFLAFVKASFAESNAAWFFAWTAWNLANLACSFAKFSWAAFNASCACPWRIVRALIPFFKLSKW